MVSSTTRPHFTPWKDPVLILQEAGWAPGPVWTAGKSRPHRDSIPDRQSRSQSPYRLSYPAQHPTEYQPQNACFLCKKVSNVKHNRDIRYVTARTKLKISFALILASSFDIRLTCKAVIHISTHSTFLSLTAPKIHSFCGDY